MDNNYGLSIVGDRSQVQIDDRLRSLHLVKTVKINLVAGRYTTYWYDTSGQQYTKYARAAVKPSWTVNDDGNQKNENGFMDYWVRFSNEQGWVYAKPPAEASLQILIRSISANPADSYVMLYIYDTINDNDISTRYGLQVFDKDSDITFDSRKNMLKLSKVFSGQLECGYFNNNHQPKATSLVINHVNLALVPVVSAFDIEIDNVDAFSALTWYRFTPTSIQAKFVYFSDEPQGDEGTESSSSYFSAMLVKI